MNSAAGHRDPCTPPCGSEIPFNAEHIIDLHDFPPNHAAEVLAAPRTALWPRG